MPRTIDPPGDGPGFPALSPRAADVRAQMDRILESPAFHVSPRRRAFLRYLVEETLAGRADGLKGYSVALAVFGRDETFDPPVPTRSCGSKRGACDATSTATTSMPAARDPVRITIPKGGYVPHFRWHRAPTDAPPSDDSGRQARAATVAGSTGQAATADETDRAEDRPAGPARAFGWWPRWSPSRSSRRPARPWLWLRGPSTADRRPRAVRRSSSCPSRRSAPARTTASSPPA